MKILQFVLFSYLIFNFGCSPPLSLYEASLAGELEKVERAITRGENINGHFYIGGTVLHLAAETGNVPLLRLLLEKGANVDAWDFERRTPLFSAASTGQIEVVNILAEAGADLNAVSKLGSTVIEVALSKNNKALFNVLLEKGANPDTKDRYGVPIFLRTVRNRSGEIHLMKPLAKYGANVNSEDNEGVSALAFAILNNPTLVDTLLQFGAQPDGTYNGEKFLIHAVRSHNEATVSALLTAGADANAETKDGTAALMLAVKDRQSDIVSSLLNANANMNIRDLDGFTPLHIAVIKNASPIVETFLLKDMDPNIKASNESGLTPLSLAAQNGFKEIVTFLLGNGAEVNLRDEEDRTALMYAAFGGHREIIAILLNAGADISSVDNKGWPPLFYAAAKGNTEIAHNLLERTTTVNTISKDGITALDIAIYKGNTQFAKWLLANGAEVDDRQALEKTLNKVEKSPMLMEAILKACARNPVGKNRTEDYQLESSYAPIREKYSLHRTKYMKKVRLLLQQGADPDWLRFTGNGKPQKPENAPQYRQSVISFGDSIANLPLKITSAKESKGITALMLAAQEGDVELVAILLVAGADSKSKDEYGWTARMYTWNATRMLNKDDMFGFGEKDRKKIEHFLLSAEDNFLNITQDILKEQQRDISTFEGIIHKHPNSPQAVIAQSRIEELEFEFAEQQDNISAYEEFMHRHPNSHQASIAQNRIINLKKENEIKLPTRTFYRQRTR